MSQTKAQLVAPVGILTASDVSVSNGTAGSPSIRFSSSATTGLYSPGTNQLALSTNGTGRLFIDSSGRLLLGFSPNLQTSSADAYALQVAGTSDPASSSGLFRFQGNSGASILSFTKSRGASVGTNTAVLNNDNLGILQFRGADGTGYIQGASISAQVDGTPGANDMPGRLVFSTTADGASSPTERMRIKNTGQFQTYTATGDAFDVAQGDAAGTTSSVFVGRYGSTSNLNSGTVSISIYNNGNIQNANNSYGSLSDIKLKENIFDAGSQWDDLKALQVRKYNFKEGQTHTQIGLIAQEVELVSPGLVSESPDRDAEGNDLGTVTKSVNYSVLYMKAVKALQEAMERIEVLETSNADLVARVTALEGV